jgi:hypothetical protein
VPALTGDALAGVQMTETLLGQIQTNMAAILFKYKNTNSSTCTSWTLQSALSAVGNTTGNWTPVVGGLILPQHFTELQGVSDLLTIEFGGPSDTNCTCLTCGGCTNHPGVVTFSHNECLLDTEAQLYESSGCQITWYDEDDDLFVTLDQCSATSRWISVWCECIPQGGWGDPNGTRPECGIDYNDDWYFTNITAIASCTNASSTFTITLPSTGSYEGCPSLTVTIP